MMRQLSVLLTALVAMAPVAGGAKAQSDAYIQAPPNVAKFLYEEFARIPAPAIAATMHNVRCLNAPVPVRDEPGTGPLGAYLCLVVEACPGVNGVTVWYDDAGVLSFGPDGPEWLVARYCPESITDPERRKALTDSVQSEAS